jgi:hypothetical protein
MKQDIEATAQASQRHLLTLVASLYGMTRIQNDAAFFLEHGLMTAQDR